MKSCVKRYRGVQGDIGGRCVQREWKYSCGKGVLRGFRGMCREKVVVDVCKGE